MIRVLTMIAAAGFVLSIGCIAGAMAIGGPDALIRSSWNFADGGDWDDWGNWGDHHRYRHERDGSWSDEDSKETTRTLAWSGAHGLDIDLAADVRYVQTAGENTVVVTGPARALSRIRIDGSHIGYDHSFRHRGYSKLSIVIHAPDISAFDISGRNSLQIEGYRQARMDLDVSGDSDVTAVGETDEISLEVSGSGDVDLGGLKTKGADVDVSGSADTTIAPTEWADIEVSGVGDVRLLTQPKKLETDISGAGKVRQAAGGSASPSPSPTPSPSPSPSPKGAKT